MVALRRSDHTRACRAEARKAAEFEAILNGLLHECGCSMGAASAISAALVFALYEVTTRRFEVSYFFALEVTVNCAFALLGKLLGLQHARIRFRGVVEELAKTLW